MGTSGDPGPEAGRDEDSETAVCVMSRSDSSILILTLSDRDFVGTGETGEAGVASRLSAFLKLRVTRLDTGSGGCSGGGGVLGTGGGPDGDSRESIFILGSKTAAEATTGSSWDLRVSTDLLREAEDGEVRRRFLADGSFSSPEKGFSRVELSSEERARSRDSDDLESWSIWMLC